MQKLFLRKAKDRIAWTAYPANWASHVRTRRESPARGDTSAIKTSVLRVQLGRRSRQRLSSRALRLGDLGPRFAEDLEAPKTTFVEILYIGRIPIIELFKNVTHG